MQEIAPAPAAPSTQELIQQCAAAINTVIKSEMSDEADADRVWILRKIMKAYLYYRDLANFSPQLFQSIVDFTGVAGPITSIPDELGNGLYDYTQNHYRGYCRKLEALLGNRMPNAIAVPNRANDEDAIQAVKTANNAALYIRHICELQAKNLYLVFGLYNFGTMFWHIDYVRDGDRFGYTPKQQIDPQQQALGDAAFNCPQCATASPADPQNPVPPANCPTCGTPMSMNNYQPPTMATVPSTTIVQQENGQLDISLHDGSEVSVPLDGTCCDTIPWLRWERTKHKGGLLRKYQQPPDADHPNGYNPLRDTISGDASEDSSVEGLYAESIRSAMASPIGLVRPKRANQWIEIDTWWTLDMFELIDDTTIRQVLKDNFKKGLRITHVKGKMVDLKNEKLSERWQECKPEPSNRIMADPLGDDWLQTQDILNNTLNQCNETIERANQPGFGDPTRVDFDALQNRRSLPGELIPALRPAGGSLSDILFFQQPLQFSEQIPQYRSGIEQTAQDISGLTPPVWGGGDAEEPTARQAELKKNAALMQLGVPWTFIGQALQRVYMKACKLLAEYEDGVLAFSKKNQFGQYSTLAVDVANLRSDAYHFEADEAIPMSWGQMRDLIMWMLDKPAPLLHQWGMDDPLNIFEFKQLLGMPGERVPGLDQRDKGMEVISQLAKAKPVNAPPDPSDPTGAPGPLQSSIQPDWEDDAAFLGALVKAYLVVNSSLKIDSPDGYQNIQLYGQACEKIANAPTPPPPAKASVALSLKGADLGDPAVQAAVEKTGLVPQGVPVQAVPPLPKQLPPGMMPPPGAQPNGLPGPPIQ